jgi:endonuclease YncB( thermonuclease family)
MAFRVNSYDSYTSGYRSMMENPYEFQLKTDADTVNTMADWLRQPEPEPEVDKKRSGWDRALDALMTPNYAIAGFVDGFLDNDEEDQRSPLKGAWEGIKAGNPFGKGYEKGETTFSDVLGTAGWNPKSTLGKFAKGTAGFVLDVGLDPTTYLTFGTSALVKGTGRGAHAVNQLSKMGKTVEAANKSTFISDLLAKGIAPDLAERFAKKKADDGAFKLADDVTHMTPDMAKSIIKSQTVKRGIVKTEDELADGAQKLADEYNRIIGIRDAKGFGDLSFGVGNMPFAPKKWEKYNLRLGSQEGLAKLSDKLKISSAYSNLRAGIYGSQIGKMFSTTSPMYKLANDDPGKLWEALEYVEHTRGLKMDKLVEEKSIRDRFKSLNLSEAETKEVVDLLQNKTVWNKIAQKAKVTDLAKFNEAKAIMQNATKATQLELDNIIQKKEVAEYWKKSLDDKITTESDFLDVMKNQFREDLAKLDTKNMTSVKQMNLVIKNLTDEIADLEKSLAKDGTEIGAMEKLYEMSQAERKAMDEHFNKADDAVNKETKTKSEQINTGDGVKEQVRLEEVLKRAEGSPGRQATKDLQEALSNHIYGESGKLPNLRDSNIDDLMKQIRDGARPEELRHFIETNPQSFSPHMQDVYQHVAEELGYKNWHGDGFKEPLGKLLGKNEEDMVQMTTLELHKEASALYQAGKMKPEQVREFMQLLQQDMQRKMLVEQFSKMTPREFTAYRTEKANEKLMKDFNETEDGMLELSRRNFIDDDAATPSRKAREARDSSYTELAKLSTGDRVNVVQDLISKGIFTKQAVNQAMDGMNTGLYKHMNAVIDEVDGLISKQFKRNYADLTEPQKNLVLRLAVQNIDKGSKGIDGTVSRRVMREMARRAREDSIRAVEKEVAKGHDLLFKVDGEMYRGIVESVKRGEDNLITYEVKIPTSGEVKQIKPSDVQKVRVDNKKLSPQELLAKSNVTQTELFRKENLVEELTKVQDEVNEFIGKSNTDRKTMTDFYAQRVKEQEGVILKLEEHSKEYTKALKEASPEVIESLTKKIEKLEETLANDDAMETWLRTHAQADLELIKDPQRYTRNIKYTDELDVPGRITWNKDGTDFIEINKKKYSPEDAYNMLGKGAQSALEKEGWDKKRIMKAFSQNPKATKKHIVEHELNHRKNKATDSKTSFLGKNGKPTPEGIQMEVRAHKEALEMIENFNVDKMLKEATPADAGKIWLSNMASSEKIEKSVRMLRAEFDRMGESEVAIGKLTEEQFEGLLGQYVPHVLTPDGAEHFSKLRELTEHGSKVSHDLGYGVVYNPHAKSRSIKGKTIDQINDMFKDKLKGKNLFSENISDIYLARAQKHVDLMYDDKYMKTMMNVFGKDIPDDGVIEKGYKAVMNHGMMKKTTSDIASMQLSVAISDEVTTFLRDNYQQFKMFARKSGMDEGSFISKQVDEYLKRNYPDEKMGEIFENLHKRVLKETRLSDDILGREGVPMVEMSSEQITAMRNAWDSAYDMQRISLDRSLRMALERGDTPRVAELQKRMEKFGKRTPPQIKQVNDVIVGKANQARKMQQAKDQSRFLQMYDKFLHFMKLNQTVVTPAFHARNKLSNAYLNWLGVGRDAVSKDLQIATTMLARTRGDLDTLDELVKGKKFGHKQLSRPLNIDNPHPSLVDAVKLNNGQLHWSDLYNLAERYGVIDKGAFAHDIGAGASTKGLFKKARINKKDGTKINLDPTDTENFVAYKKGTDVGTVVENGDRILHFASLLRQGKSIDEATRSSKQFLFDYSDLTAFEQSVMKRVFPYYTWLRKNARLQVSQLIDQPDKFRDVAKVMTGIDHMTPEEDRMNSAYIGDWAQDWVQMPWDVEVEPAEYDAETGEGKEAKTEKVIANPALPFMDLSRIPDPTQPMDSIKELFTQMAPQIKVPIEQAMNKNVFLDSDIAGEKDNPFLERVKHLASQFGAYNYGSGFAQKDNPADMGMHTLATFGGVKMNSVDYERSKFMFKDKQGKSGDSVIDKFVDSAKEKASGLLAKPIDFFAEQKEKYMRGMKIEREINQAVVKGDTDKILDVITAPSHRQPFALANVSKVTDGDTIKVKPYGSDKEVDVRMLLVDTPESAGDYENRPMPHGKEASDFTKSIASNESVVLVFDKKQKDKYGRMLAYVHVGEDMEDLNKKLLEEGHARFAYNQDDNSRAREYKRVEGEARTSERGVWSIADYLRKSKREDDTYYFNKK